MQRTGRSVVRSQITDSSSDLECGRGISVVYDVFPALARRRLARGTRHPYFYSPIPNQKSRQLNAGSWIVINAYLGLESPDRYLRVLLHNRFGQRFGAVFKASLEGF